MHIKIIFISIILINLDLQESFSQCNNVFSDSLEKSSETSLLGIYTEISVSKHCYLQGYTDSSDFFHAKLLYISEKSFYKRDSIFSQFIFQLNKGLDTIRISSLCILISRLDFIQIHGTYRFKAKGNPKYFLNSKYIANDVKLFYFFNVSSYKFLVNTKGINSVYISHLFNGEYRKYQKQPPVFEDAEFLSIVGEFEKEYDKCFPNVRILQIRDQENFNYDNFSKLEKIYFISFSIIELEKSNIFKRQSIDILMYFFYDKNYHFEMISHLNLQSMNVLKLCFRLQSAEQVNRYINVIQELSKSKNQNTDKVKVCFF